MKIHKACPFWLLLTIVVSPTFPITLPSAYGKTHFIVGISEEELLEDQYSDNCTAECRSNSSASVQPQELPSAPIVITLAELDVDKINVFFPPDDDVHKLLLELLSHEKTAISMAAYMLTDRTIAQALVDARDRGVRVEIITDSGCLKSEVGQIQWLQKQGISIHVYFGWNRATMSNIMHDKFIVFAKNKDNKKVVWTGSFNFTQSARKNNQENVVIFGDAYATERFTHQFELIKSRCLQIAKPTLARSPKTVTRIHVVKNTRRAKSKAKLKTVT